MDTFVLEPFNSIYYFEKHYGDTFVPSLQMHNNNSLLLIIIMGVILTCFIFYALRRSCYNKLM